MRRRHSRHYSACLCAIALIVLPALPRTVAAQATPAPAGPTARKEDVESLDAIVAALYDVISGPAGQKRDWDRFRSLFAPGARLIPTGKRADGSHSMRVLTPDEYATNSATPLETNGFFEREIGRAGDQFGGIVQIFSAYESRRAANDPKPFARGINSIQLANDGKRWWIVTVFWEAERADNPIPQKYIGKPKPDGALDDK
jgi:hypothetical protein